MKKIILSFVIASTLLEVSAQQSTTTALSLQQAVDFAVKNSPNYLNAENDVVLAKYKRKELTGIGLPQVTASLDLKDFIKIPTSVLPNFVSPAIYGTLLEYGFAPYDPSKLTPDGYAPIEAQFGTRYQATAGVSASQIIFSSDYIVGLQAAKEFINLSQLNANRTKAELVAQVSKAYYNVLVNKERIKLLDANITRLSKLLSDTKAFNKQGFVENIDVDRLEVAYNNLVTEKEKIDRLISLSEVVLKFQMGFNLKDNLTLSDSLNVDVSTENIDGSKVDITKRPEFQLLESQQKLNNLNLKRYRLGYLPTVVAYGSYSQQALRTEFDVFSANKKWFPTAIIGGSINLNVFDGLQRHYKIQQTKIDILKSEQQLKQLQMAIELESAVSSTTYNNAASTMLSQKKNMELAKHVCEVVQKKYEQGLGSNIEIINAETSLRESQTNYYNAVFDLLVAKIDYQKAIGTLTK